MRRLLITITCASTVAVFGSVKACQTYSASDVADAIRNSPNASQTLKDSACTFGGAAIAESGGNTCSSNGNNFGVLQLTSSNLPPGVGSSQYLNEGLQDQVNDWARQVGNSNTSGGYQTLANNGLIGGTAVTPGMQAACFQFGPAICRNDINYMQNNNGQCPSASSGGVRATGGRTGTLHDGTANLDGNNQSICSWGRSIQSQINQNAVQCKNTGTCLWAGQDSIPTDTSAQVASNVPAPSAADVNVDASQV